MVPTLGAMFLANAAFADVPEQVLYVRQVRVGEVVVDLPTMQKSDGSVCMSYLSSTSRDSTGRLNIRVDQVCDKLGKARESILAPGRMEVRPANLSELQTVRTGDLVVEVPQLESATSK